MEVKEWNIEDTGLSGQGKHLINKGLFSGKE
jgi:hypothetical protein